MSYPFGLSAYPAPERRATRELLGAAPDEALVVWLERTCSIPVLPRQAKIDCRISLRIDRHFLHSIEWRRFLVRSVVWSST